MRISRIIFFCVLAACLLGFFLASGFTASIVSSKHNLSVSGPGTIKAEEENKVCIFCHTPHSASSDAPLWNRYQSGENYTTYTSSTIEASIGQPTGASKLCLSCHDGTVALGMVRSRPDEISFGSIGVLPEGDSRLGIDLSDDHPVSFYYDASLASQNSELKDPSALTGAVKLDKSGRLQCTSCHNPHNDEYGDFLSVDGINSNLCVTCHDKSGWSNSSHRLSGNTWNSASPDPWPHTDWDTVAENACESCHNPHSAEGRERLLNYVSEEENCFACHNSNVAEKDISAEFNNKTSTHPVGDSIGLHDPVEPALLSSSRHIECGDCHNPHAVNDQDSPDLAGSLRLIKGVDSGGADTSPINYEYELCFRCHADTSSSTVYVDRQYPETNTRVEFDPTNNSYHPIENIGNNLDVPSLISPYTTSSIIKCTDCHNNNEGPNNSGTGPDGPHGSIYSPLLERQLLFSDGLTESYDVYAMCYKCHDRNSILGNQSFPKHSSHIKGKGMMGKGAPCTACHDSHGVKTNKYLINFDKNIVSSSSSGKLSFEDTGLYSGTCYLRCHSTNHNPKSY